MSPADEAQELLTATSSRPLLGVWSAPGRVNLIGEHTDYNEGFVLPFAIAQRTAAAVAPRSDGVLSVRSSFTDRAVAVELADLDQAIARRDLGWAAYPLGVAWALRRLAPDLAPCGLDIAIASDVPVGSGLSSSAAIEGAVAGALNEVWEAGLTPVDLARVGRAAENDAVGAPTGIMDQMASMLGRADAATFLDCRSLEARSVELGFAREGLEVLVIDTLVSHAHASGGYGERRASCEAGAAALGVAALRDVAVADLPDARERLAREPGGAITFRRVRHIVTENQRVLDTVHALTSSGPRTIGDLLTASHVSMRDDFEISVPELDLAVEAALAHGALGARMTGGGFGGAAIALVEADDVPLVNRAVTAAFAEAGYGAPRVFTVVPSGGARRDR